MDVQSYLIAELWALIPTIIYAVVGLALLGISIWIMERVAPFSIRKEIEEDQNTSLAVLMGSMFIALAIVIAAVIQSGAAGQ